jgi:hypothetical protein
MTTRCSWLQFECRYLLKMRVWIALVLVFTICNPLLANVQCVIKNGKVLAVSKVVTPFVQIATGVDVYVAR